MSKSKKINSSEGFLKPQEGWQLLGFLAHQLLLEEDRQRGHVCLIEDPVVKDALQAVAKSFKTTLKVKIGHKRHHKDGTTGEETNMLSSLYLLVRDTFQAVQDGHLIDKESAKRYLEEGLHESLQGFLTNQDNIARDQLKFNENETERQRLHAVIDFIISVPDLLVTDVKSEGPQGPQADALTALHRLTGNKSKFDLALSNSRSQFWTTAINDHDIQRVLNKLKGSLSELDYLRNNDLKQISFIAQAKKVKKRQSRK